MACTCTRQHWLPFIRQASLSAEASDFLLPSVAATRRQRRCFSSAARMQSRIGRAAVSIPPEVSLKFFDLPTTNTRTRSLDTPRSAVEISGPLGQMTLNLPPYLEVDHNQESKKVTLGVQDTAEKHQRSMWGTMRSHIQNCVTGVSEGHVCILRLVGVGYRASIEKKSTITKAEFPGQEFLALKLGFAHPVEMGIPKGVKAGVPQPTRILLEGPDKEVVTMFASKIRDWRRPEPYKGKGIFVNNETIKLKAKKIK